MHVFWKWQALGSAIIGNQHINTVLERYWFKIWLPLFGKWPKLSINRSTGFGPIHIFGKWQAFGSVSWWSTNQRRFGELLVQNLTIGKMTKIVNQRINRFWTHTHIWKMASLISASWWSTNQRRFGELLVQNFNFPHSSKFGKLPINRSTGFGPIYILWQVLASIGDQQINAVLESYWFKIWLLH